MTKTGTLVHMAHVTWRGVTLDARTAAMMDEVAKRTKAKITPVQGSYSNGSLSAGTHSGGGAIDIHVIGYSTADILDIVHVMREVGFAAWWRRLPEWTSAQHVHAIAVGCPDLTKAAAAQVTSLRNGRNGLANNLPDRHADMKLPVITWETYLAHKSGAVPVVPKAPAAPAPKKIVALAKGVKPGAHDPQVKYLQSELVRTGFLKGGGTPTDYYGPITQGAVAAFQNKYPKYKGYGLVKDVKIGSRGFAFLQTLPTKG